MPPHANTGADPIDAAVLDRQTYGDRTLQKEILALFVQQASVLGDPAEPGRDRQQLTAIVHRLKGSAGTVGAGRLEQAADRLEAALADGAGTVDPLLAEELEAARADACRFAAMLISRFD